MRGRVGGVASDVVRPCAGAHTAGPRDRSKVARAGEDGGRNQPTLPRRADRTTWIAQAGAIAAAVLTATVLVRSAAAFGSHLDGPSSGEPSVAGHRMDLGPPVAVATSVRGEADVNRAKHAADGNPLVARAGSRTKTAAVANVPVLPRRSFVDDKIDVMVGERGGERLWVASPSRLTRVSVDADGTFHEGTTWNEDGFSAFSIVADQDRLIVQGVDGTLVALQVDGSGPPQETARIDVGRRAFVPMALDGNMLLLGPRTNGLVARDAVTLELLPAPVAVEGSFSGIAANADWLWVSRLIPGPPGTPPPGVSIYRSELLAYRRDEDGGFLDEPVAQFEVVGALRHLVAEDNRIITGGDQTGLVVAEADGLFGSRIVRHIVDMNHGSARDVLGLVVQGTFAFTRMAGNQTHAYRIDRSRFRRIPGSTVGGPALAGGRLVTAQRASLSVHDVADDLTSTRMHHQVWGLGTPAFGTAHGDHLWATGYDELMLVYDVRPRGHASVRQCIARRERRRRSRARRHAGRQCVGVRRARTFRSAHADRPR